MKANTRAPRLRRSRDEEELDTAFADDDAVERSWGYEIPVRHRLAAPRREPAP